LKFLTLILGLWDQIHENAEYLAPNETMKVTIRNMTADPAVITLRQAKLLCSRRSLGYAPPSLVHPKLITGIVRLLGRIAP
jgi:hypothetical protein